MLPSTTWTRYMLWRGEGKGRTGREIRELFPRLELGTEFKTPFYVCECFAVCMYVCDSVSSYGGQMMVLDPPLEPESQDTCDLMLIIKRVTAKLSLYPPN